MIVKMILYQKFRDHLTCLLKKIINQLLPISLYQFTHAHVWIINSVDRRKCSNPSVGTQLESRKETSLKANWFQEMEKYERKILKLTRQLNENIDYCNARVVFLNMKPS